MKELNFDITVVANHHRKALIEDYLKDINHYTSYSQDVNLPDNWTVEPKYSHLVQHMHGHIGANRCLEGHKSALRMCKKDIILVLEDDAMPNRRDWLDIVMQSVLLVEKHELVSLHGRNANFEVFNKSNFFLRKDIYFYTPKDTSSYRYVLGSLAYLIKKKDVDKIYQHNYNGLVMDLFIANCFDFCMIDPSPFDHNRSQGSLIDV